MSMSSIVALSLAAILTENLIFVKFLGVCSFVGVSKKTETALGMGTAVIFVMTMASAVTYWVNRVLVHFQLEYMQTVAFILVIASLVQLVEMFLIKMAPALHRALGIYLPLITTNCAVLGVAILSTQSGLSFTGSVLYGLTAALGFTLAIVLFASIREKLDILADCPRAFQGFPIALVTAALLALAFMGFQGVKVF